MACKFHAEGDSVDYTPPSDMVSGEAVKFGTVMGCAAIDIDANKKGALRVNGIFRATIDADEFTGSYPVAVGTEADFDFTNQKVVASGGDVNVKVFLAETVTAAAGATQTEVQVWINKIG